MKTPNYKNYGSRGIRVCEEWKNSFEAFEKWSADNGYREGLSIDRIDNDGNYEPENCRWVDYDVQNMNRRNTIKVIHRGKEKTLLEIEEETGVPYNILKHRLYRGVQILKDDEYKAEEGSQ